MRVTQSMLQRSLLRNIRADQTRLAEAQRRVATGKRLLRASDDPVAAAQTMRSAQGLRAIDQFRRNSGAVRAQLDAEEAVLDQVTDLLARTRELGTAGGSDTASDDALRAMHAEVEEIFEHVVQLGNTVIGDEYIFAGHRTLVAPFQADGTYVGDTNVRQVDIGSGYRVSMNHHGRTLLVDSGVVAAVARVRDALAAADNAGVEQSLADVVTAFQQTQVLLGDVGARQRELDVAGQNLDALDTSFTAQRQAAEEIDLEEAAIEFFGVQTTLQAALASTARILDTNLSEFLL